jgi:hypothetical protein
MPRSLNFSQAPIPPRREVRRTPPRADVRAQPRTPVFEILFIALISAVCVFIVLMPAG